MPERWRGLVARSCLTAAALLPYWRILTFSVVLATDDYFTSDIYNGELPGRVLVAQALRAGRAPLWTNAMCSGYPLAGFPADPPGLALFTWLPPAAALDAMIAVILLVAAHGTYSLARRWGADRTSAVLAGIAFSGSGYIATQLKHLSIMSTIIWLPVGLVVIDRIFTAERRRRPLLLATLGVIFAMQVLAGFPQSAYISALVYGAFLLFRLVEARRRIGAPRDWIRLVTGFAAAFVLGAAAGAVVLLPLNDLAAYTDRVAPLDYHWATYTNFWPRNFFTFFIPYINGDTTDATYIGPTPFWENYGYVGLATALLAFYGGVRERRRPVVAFTILMTILAFAFILGPHTPIYYAAFKLVPGMDHFRAPTRFMVVVDLGLALLGGIGLTRLRADLARRWSVTPRVTSALAIAVCLATVLDLFIHQPRQNALVPARDWLAPPQTAGIVRADSPAPRTFAPHHRDVHRQVDQTNHGWANIAPYYQLRELLAPDTGAYWDLPSADCYVGLAPRWYVTIWSYHYFENSIVSEAAFEDFDRQRFDVKPGFVTLMRAYGVTHLLTALPGGAPGLTPIGAQANIRVLRVEGSARARVVRSARVMTTDALAVARLRDRSFDPDAEVVLLDAPSTLRPAPADVPVHGGSAGTATITRDDPEDVVIDTTAAADGFLLLADMYYPGWTASVDGVATPVYRANVSVRAVALPKGHHTVRFTFESKPFARGLRITSAALLALVGWLGVACYGARR